MRLAPRISSPTPRKLSAAIMRTRREKRSATTPPTKRNATCAKACAPSTYPKSAVEWLSRNTANTSATGTNLSPSEEVALPMNKSLKLRSRRARTVNPVFWWVVGTVSGRGDGGDRAVGSCHPGAVPLWP